MRWPWGGTTAVPPAVAIPDPAGTAEVAARFSAIAADDVWFLPFPGGGKTYERCVGLAEVSAVDLSMGRLFEGHADALAILDEAGRKPPAAGVMGVWAARRHDADVTGTRHEAGWRLRGRKPWASGAHTLTHALVTAVTSDGDRLFEVTLSGEGVTVVPGTWPAVGMSMSDSADVELDIVVGGDSPVGPPRWYTDRPGFWFGSVGVAACWLGGAIGLVRALQSDLTRRSVGERPADPHQLAHLGAAVARCASMARDIAWAAARIDASPYDPDREMREVALEVRHLVESGCLEVLVHVGRAGGAGPICHDPVQSRRMADLPVYIRQHHAERDTEALGRSSLTGRLEW